ncbi:MAG TPA: hypothetical protein VJV39_07540 [Dongiaceae bacterium]|nr:hypothetical protein [Dongiaceae bacterium]
MRAVIHIGLTKTGTSSLQQAFDGERDLLARHGISFLLPPGRKPPVDHRLANAVARNDRAAIEERWREIEPLTEDARTVLISSENFQNAAAEGIAALKDVLDRRLSNPDYTIYVGIRRWADRLASLWQQAVRHGSPAALPTYVEAQLAAPAPGHPLDVARPIARWSGAFGRQAVVVSSMDQALESGQDIAAYAFHELFGIAGLKHRYLANVSVIEQTELIRAINMRHVEMLPVQRRAIIRSVLRFWERQKPNVLAASELIAKRLQTLSIADDHPLFRQLEANSGYAFPSRPPRAWRFAPDAVFDERDIRALVSAIDKKAVQRAQRVSSQRAR